MFVYAQTRFRGGRFVSFITTQLFWFEKSEARDKKKQQKKTVNAQNHSKIVKKAKSQSFLVKKINYCLVCSFTNVMQTKEGCIDSEM